MLQLVGIVSSSGILLTVKEIHYTLSKPPRMYASILAAMVEKGLVETDNYVQHILYDNMAIAIVTGDKMHAFVLYDSGDGVLFGDSVAQAVLHNYSVTQELTLPLVYRTATEWVLERLKRQRGVEQAMILDDNSSAVVVDRVSVLSCWEALRGACGNISKQLV